MTSKERDPMWDFKIKDKLKYLWTTIVNLYGEIEPLESYQEENKIRARKCCESILSHLERLEQLEIADRNNQNLVKTNVDLINKNLALQKDNNSLQGLLDTTKEDYINIRLENEKLEKEIQELKDKNTKMFVELSNTVTVLNKFFEYLDKDKTKLIAKYSLKETLCKIVDKVEIDE